MQNFRKGQQGFTLLELLVVITLLAVLAVGALVAYENIGENAEAVAAANNAATVDRAIRTYRAVEFVYPNQWDSLVTTAGAATPILADATQTFVANWAVAGATTADQDAFYESLEKAGIDEIQFANTVDAGVAPNRAHNEGTNTGAVEVDTDAVTNISVIPTGACTGAGTRLTGIPATSLNGSNYAAGTPLGGAGGNRLLNALNDSLEDDACHLVVALGFGGDAAASTTGSQVAISQSPAYTRKGVIDPAQHYSRYIGLFQVGKPSEGGAEDEIGDILPKAKLLAIVTPDGKNIDQLVAENNN